MYDWSGTVPAKLEQGQPTGLILKKGDVISVVANGWVKYGHPDNYWAAPQSSIPTNPTGREQKINSSNYQVQWDRESSLDLILKELLELFESEQQMINLIKDQIPDELRGIIYPKLKLAC
ncbi:LecA/PA-IL family lectin [Xenorhabdus nematophila]|uniref:LecA/PA-IL family lectin n=1 Tax=Xenorhabdus nematophila TaxID=628 RepID=UPI000327580D|nr:LecA/PA-IL family lectin [Xenorhabdus nematophila]CCW31686.1 hypothetical protein XNC3_2710001 [Xenorhabdus nematophila F1]